MEESAEGDQLDAMLKSCEHPQKESLCKEKSKSESCEDLDELHRSILSLCDDNCITIDETKGSIADVVMTEMKASTSEKYYSNECVGKIQIQDPGLSPIKLAVSANDPQVSAELSNVVSGSNILCLDEVDQTYEELITEITALCESHNSESEDGPSEEEVDKQLIEENRFLSSFNLGSIISSTPNPDLVKRDGRECKFTFDIDSRVDGDTCLARTGFGENLQTLSISNTSTAIHDTPNLAVMKASILGMPGRFKHVDVSRQTNIDSTLNEDIDDAGIDILGLDEFTTMVESDEDELEENLTIEQWQTVLHKLPEGDDTLKDSTDGHSESQGKEDRKRSSSVFVLDLKEHSLEVKDFLASDTKKDEMSLGSNLELKRRKVDESFQPEMKPTEGTTVDVRKIVRDQIAEMVREVKQTGKTVPQQTLVSDELDVHKSDTLESKSAEDTQKQSRIVRNQIADLIREVNEGGRPLPESNSMGKPASIRFSEPPLSDESKTGEKQSQSVRDQIAKIVREVNPTKILLPEAKSAVENSTNNTWLSDNYKDFQSVQKCPKIIFGQLDSMVDEVEPKNTAPNNKTHLLEVDCMVNKMHVIPPEATDDKLNPVTESDLQNDSWIIIDLADLSDIDEPLSKKGKLDTLPSTGNLLNRDITEETAKVVHDQIAEIIEVCEIGKMKPHPGRNEISGIDLSKLDLPSLSDKVESAGTPVNDTDNEADLSESDMILLSDLPEETELLGSSRNDASDLSESEMISILEMPVPSRMELKKVVEAKDVCGPTEVSSKVEARSGSKSIPRKLEESTALCVEEKNIMVGPELPPKFKTEIKSSKPVNLKRQKTITIKDSPKTVRTNIPKDKVKGLQAPRFDSCLVKVLGDKDENWKKTEEKVIGQAVAQKTKSLTEVSNLTVKKPEAKVQPMPAVNKKVTLKPVVSVNRSMRTDQGHLGISPRPVGGVAPAEGTTKVDGGSIFLEEDNEIIQQVKQRWQCDGIPTPDANLTCANYWRMHQLKGPKPNLATRNSYLEGNFRASPMVDRINQSKEQKATSDNVVRGTKRKRERDEVVVDSSNDYRWDGKRTKYDHDAKTGSIEDAASSLKKQLNKLRQEFRQRVQSLLADQDVFKREMVRLHAEQMEHLRRRQTREMQSLYVNCYDTRLLQRPFYVLRNHHQSQLHQVRHQQFQEIESMEAETKRKMADERKKFVSIENQLQHLLEKDEGKLGDIPGMVYKTVSLTKGPCKSNGLKKSWVKVFLPADIASAIIREDLIYDAFYTY